MICIINSCVNMQANGMAKPTRVVSPLNEHMVKLARVDFPSNPSSQ